MRLAFRQRKPTLNNILSDRGPSKPKTESIISGPHRQKCLRAVEGLHLALLVDAQHDGTLGRRQVTMRFKDRREGSLDLVC